MGLYLPETSNFKVLNVISYNREQRLFLTPRKAFENINYSEYVLRLQKRRQIRTKVENLLKFFEYRSQYIP